MPARMDVIPHKCSGSEFLNDQIPSSVKYHCRQISHPICRSPIDIMIRRRLSGGIRMASWMSPTEIQIETIMPVHHKTENGSIIK